MKPSPKFWLWAVLATVAAVAIPLPLFFIKLRLDTDLIGFTAMRMQLPFELFGFTSSALVFGCAYALRRYARDERSRAAFIGLTLIALYASILIAETSVRTGDYGAYERAARGVRTGGPLYGYNYLYPPLLALTLAGLSASFERLGKILHLSLSPDAPWICTFYAYQLSLFFAYVVAAALTLREAMGLVNRSPLARVAFVAAIFIVNDAVLRVFQYNQINFALLSLVLVALALIRYPVWAGLALAAAVHLKVYPLLLLVPFMIGRKFALVGWTLVFIALLGGAIALTSAFALGRDLWGEFFAFLPDWPRGVMLRDDSVHSFLYNTVSLIIQHPLAIRVALIDSAIVGVLAVSYMILRQRDRAKALRAEDLAAGHLGPALSPRSARRLALDALPFLFLVSPSVWEHHWVLLLPFVATIGFEASFPADRAQHPDIITLGAIAAILSTPTFDLYPFSYCRLVGLLILVARTHPRAPARSAVLSPSRPRAGEHAPRHVE